MSDKVNSHICVYNSFHQMVKYERNHILQDSTGLEM